MAKKENYLDYVPVHALKHSWTADDDGLVTVHMRHDGVYDRIAQRFFHRPAVSHIDLDEQGSFVWQQIDGERTVGQIAQAVKAQFGDQAEPLYDRLVQYMKILHNNGFIAYRRQERQTK